MLRLVQSMQMQFQSIGRWTAEFSQRVTNPVSDIGRKCLATLNQSSIWQDIGKPLYERHIQPLSKTDYRWMTAILISSLVIMVITLLALGFAALPLAIGIGAVGMIGCVKFSQQKVRKQCNALAWEQIDQIRRKAHELTHKNRQFGKINQCLEALQKPEFEYLYEDLRALSEETRKFRDAALVSPYQDDLQIVQAHLGVVKRLVQTNAQDKALVEALEKEIDKVGKKEQDLTAIETNKQKLHELNTQEIWEHRVELNSQINSLIKAAQRPKFIEAKANYIAFLNTLLRKLVWHKAIEDLQPIDLDDSCAEDNSDILEDVNLEKEINIEDLQPIDLDDSRAEDNSDILDDAVLEKEINIETVN